VATINGVSVEDFSYVTAVGADYVDVYPDLSIIPIVGRKLERASIGNVFVWKEGIKYKLMYGRDYTTEDVGPVAPGSINKTVLAIRLADNFEANFPAIGIFGSDCQVTFRVYGPKSEGSIADDLLTGNLTAANGILLNILYDYSGLGDDDFDLTEINAISCPALSFVYPENTGEKGGTIRELIDMINKSVLGHTYFKIDGKMSYRLIGPMGASEYELTDSELLNLSIQFDSQEIYNRISLFFNRKESPFGNGIAQNDKISAISDMATFLHEVEKTLDIYSFLLRESEAATIAQRYSIIYEDFNRIYTARLKTQLMEKTNGTAISISRSGLPGYNFDRTIKYSKNLILSKIKKSVNGMELGLVDQKTIEDNAGVW